MPFEERTIRRFLTNKAAIDWLVADIYTLGFQGKRDLSRLSPSHPDAHDFSDATFFVSCRHKEGTNGGTFEDWRIVRPVAKPKAASDEDIDRATRRLGKLFEDGFTRFDAKPAAQEQADDAEPVLDEAVSF